MLNDKIQIAKGFKTSVNISYDLNNDEKVKNFIPTMSSIDVIEDVLLSTVPDASQRARVLIGAYGRGKSHIILVLLSLLYKKDIVLFEGLLQKIETNNPKLYEFVVEYINGSQKLLPIIINGSSASLTQSFLCALQKALRAEALEDLMPETNFEASINAINLWKQSFPDTYNRFTNELREPVDAFILSLKEYDISAYEKFEKLYPTLTSGSQFNPYLGFDVVELYEKVVDKLKDRGYNGIYIIYDEFSKYLESSIANASISDIKLLQDFAEKCDRSGNKQIHLMLISHKDISNYIDGNLPKEKVDGWRGVSARFKHINLHNNFSQMYEIISAVIKKKEPFADYIQQNRDRFTDLLDRFTASGLFDNKDKELNQIAIVGCYPLHPVSTFILPRLSEKVAQNERTLFTFLSSDQKFTLSTFLLSSEAEGEFPLLTPDYIYDYFEPLLRKEPYTTETHKIYKLTSSVLKKVEPKSLASKIVKTISLIYIIEQFEKLPPVFNTIVDVYSGNGYEIKDISIALLDLIQKECVVYQKRSNNFLRLKESSGLDIPGEINKFIEKNRSTLSVKNILNGSTLENYLYPTGYNEQKEMTRYFDFIFMDSSEFWEINNWDKRISSISADGVVYAIVPQNQEEIGRLKEALLSVQYSHARILFIVLNQFIDIEKMAYEYYAVNQLKTLASDDELLADEYDLYIEDLSEIINSFIMSYTRPETGRAEHFYMGKNIVLKRKAQVSALLSQICEEIYIHTPIINNESINKNNLPTVAINSRAKLLTGLLENELKISLGLSGTGQDVSIMRSTMIQTGILVNVDTNPSINLDPEDDNIRMTLHVIRDFFITANSSEGTCFQTLYNLLIVPENGFGLRKGVIPIFIAAVLHKYKRTLVIKEGENEAKITADLLNNINQNPEKFSVVLENWSEEKSQYMTALGEIFSDFLNEKEKSYNSFSYIVFAMRRWYMSLPKYSKEMDTLYLGMGAEYPSRKIETKSKKFINSVKLAERNPRDFLFDKTLKIFGFSSFNIKVVDSIQNTKSLYDSAKIELVKVLIEDIKSIFSVDLAGEASLTSTMRDWYEGLHENTTHFLFENNENRILDLIKSISNDEVDFIENLGKVVTSLRIDDWTSETINDFIITLSDFKKTVEELDTQNTGSTASSTNMYKLIFVDSGGKEEVKTFSKTDYSDRAKLLFNDISTSIEEMGSSISEQEKRQVLMELLEKMC